MQESKILSTPTRRIRTWYREQGLEQGNKVLNKAGNKVLNKAQENLPLETS